MPARACSIPFRHSSRTERPCSGRERRAPCSCPFEEIDLPGERRSKAPGDQGGCGGEVPESRQEHDKVTRQAFRLSTTPSRSGSPRNFIDRENAVSTRRRDLVAGASALAVLSGSSAAFAQNEEAPAGSRAKPAAGSGSACGITIQGGSLARPANQEELRALLQAACHNGGGIAFDGLTPPIKITRTLEIHLRSWPRRRLHQRQRPAPGIGQPGRGDRRRSLHLGQTRGS